MKEIFGRIIAVFLLFFLFGLPIWTSIILFKSADFTSMGIIVPIWSLVVLGCFGGSQKNK